MKASISEGLAVTSATFGASYLRRAVEALEQASKAQDALATRILVGDVQKIFEETAAATRAWLVPGHGAAKAPPPRAGVAEARL